jgi:hypothetical protein
MQITLLDIHVQSIRPALLQCRIRLAHHAQNKLLHLLELLFKVQRKIYRQSLS